MTPFSPEQIIGNVYLLKFPNQYELTSTMLRFQEHYESPKFRKQIFSLEEFKQWYSGNKEFTYYEDWSGFNFPSSVFELFRSDQFDDLSPSELQLLRLTKDIPEPFYLISVYEDGHPDTLLHEIAHGLYATNPDYKAEVLTAMEGANLSPIIRYLMPDYHPAVFIDECHAYLSADFGYLLEEGLRIDYLRDVHLSLKAIFDHYTDHQFEVKG